MRKFISAMLIVIMMMSIAVLAVSAADADTAPSAAGTATVTLYNIKGESVTQTYAVGETFTAYTYLNVTENEGRISSVSALQEYTTSVLEIAEPYNTDEQDEDYGVITSTAPIMPILSQKGSSMASVSRPGTFKYNATFPNTSGYLFNSDNSELVVIRYTVTAPGEATITNGITTLAETDLYLTKIISGGKFKEGKADVVVNPVALSEPTLPVPSGYTVSGSVTSFLDAEGEITLVLLQGDDHVKTVKVNGNTTAYTMEDVPAGEYVLSVSKKNHVTREYPISVVGEDVPQNVKIHPYGDINGDGKLNSRDISSVNGHMKGKSLTGYPYACADANHDKKVNTRDVVAMNAHVKGKSLWTE